MPSGDEPADATESRQPADVTTFDPSAGQQPSLAVPVAVASFTEEDPLELTPLYEVVEPDALDSLFEHAARTDGNGVHQLWFRYEGVDVGVRSDGQIEIDAPTADPS
ncbi:hypothetical protein EA462_01630 [Natrarchaeobius halalkaliphilus]|uniref:Halobacterial output domain-containing protein n=1 Tax=Natrarchaeobius halalkaliphilus TaxID=1679091 RepID=A0A3N6P9L8_9EURY|nr:HalOD1 output domain-containing protein [Natrarchaeobius halalkaliphilus]RQG92945.1 hypothetical protein EA462_01630 [Natrarchaeobius halalkaliphilus]